MRRMKFVQRLCFYMLTVSVCFSAAAQNTVVNEVLPYKDVEGYIIIKANVGGTEGDFLLDSRGKVAVTEQAAAVRGMKSDKKANNYPREGFQVLGNALAIGFFVGNTVYQKDIQTRILKENALLTRLKVDGVINFSAFANAVVTINSKAKTITLSTPYKPAYMKLVNRDDAELSFNDGLMIQTTINGKPVKAVVDFYEDRPLVLSVNDAKLINPGNGASATVKVAGVSLNNVKVAKGNATYTIIGKSILNKGVISFDIGRNKYYFQSFNQVEETSPPVVNKEIVTFIPGKVNPIDRTYFLKNVYDYKTNKEWKTIGDKPVVIDFWATWCGPCMKMMPVMEELAAKYKDRINFYKVNVDKEGELRQVFEANAIPLVIFGSLNNGSTKEIGADTKEKVEARILELLK
ncbi:thioredoxin domain-containing protein [Pedobacter nutrimenti]|uniref:thioredoxin domain-containing protein n=1 Tax=Pedobacter nutrimenti TaxID=1241337 RepID=UPI00292D996D|nr:thioredoxin domain-containing protein [Pedobacter nutrimenti]